MSTFNFLRKSFLPGTPDVGTVFELRADISIIGHFFNFFVTGLYISFDKSKSVLCFPCDVIYVGSPVIVTPRYLAALVTLSSFLCNL